MSIVTDVGWTKERRSEGYTACVTGENDDLSSKTYGIVLVLEAAIILLLWILGRVYA